MIMRTLPRDRRFEALRRALDEPAWQQFMEDLKSCNGDLEALRAKQHERRMAQVERERLAVEQRAEKRGGRPVIDFSVKHDANELALRVSSQGQEARRALIDHALGFERPGDPVNVCYTVRMRPPLPISPDAAIAMRRAQVNQRALDFLFTYMAVIPHCRAENAAQTYIHGATALLDQLATLTEGGTSSRKSASAQMAPHAGATAGFAAENRSYFPLPQMPPFADLMSIALGERKDDVLADSFRAFLAVLFAAESAPLDTLRGMLPPGGSPYLRDLRIDMSTDDLIKFVESYRGAAGAGAAVAPTAPLTTAPSKSLMDYLPDILRIGPRATHAGPDAAVTTHAQPGSDNAEIARIVAEAWDVLQPSGDGHTEHASHKAGTAPSLTAPSVAGNRMDMDAADSHVLGMLLDSLDAWLLPDIATAVEEMRLKRQVLVLAYELSLRSRLDMSCAPATEAPPAVAAAPADSARHIRTAAAGIGAGARPTTLEDAFARQAVGDDVYAAAGIRIVPNPQLRRQLLRLLRHGVSHVTTSAAELAQLLDASGVRDILAGRGPIPLTLILQTYNHADYLETYKQLTQGAKRAPMAAGSAVAHTTLHSAPQRRVTDNAPESTLAKRSIAVSNPSAALSSDDPTGTGGSEGLSLSELWPIAWESSTAAHSAPAPTTPPMDPGRVTANDIVALSRGASDPDVMLEECVASAVGVNVRLAGAMH